MKFTSLAALAACSIIALGSCNKPSPDPAPEEPVVPKADYTFIVDTSYHTDIIDYWVFIHGQDGKLLQTYPLKKGDTIQYFASPDRKSDPLNISYASSALENGTRYVRIFTYLDVTRGGSRFISYASGIGRMPGTGDATGNFNLKIENDPGAVYNATLPYGMSTGYAAAYAGNSFTTLQSTCYPDAKYMLVKQYLDKDPAYCFIDNAAPDQTVEVAGTAFKTFDKVLHIPLNPGETSFYLVNDVRDPKYPYDGYYLNDQFSLNFHPDYYSNPPTDIRLGYLDSFSTYHTWINIYGPTRNWSYESVGPMPASLDFPDASNFNIQSSSFNNYRCSTSLSYVSRNASWSKTFADTREDFNWQVNGGPNATQPALEIPSMWTGKISAASLNYGGTSFTLLNEDFTKVGSNGINSAIRKSIKINP